MTVFTDEDRRAIRNSVQRLLAERASEPEVRRFMASPKGYDEDLWGQLAAIGMTGLLVPEEHGGIGGTAREVEEVMEEAGAALLTGPLYASGVLAAALLAASDNATARARLLPGIASGDRIATVAITGEKGLWTSEDVAVHATAQGEGWTLAGVSSFVLWADAADILLVVATGPAGLQAFEVDRGAAGVRIDPLQSWDRTLRLSRITFHDVPAEPVADADAIDVMLDHGRVALAGEQAGAARHVFEKTIEYLRTRVQFGRPIGGFQALKHMAADLLVEVESATSAARAAAAALASNAPDKDVLINLAAFACADAFSLVAAQSIQMHGGIAFTAEHFAHLYLRRARADARLLGPSRLYRDKYLTALELAA
jgi:alkylation response protein AidB-like acyl-CoA dehydrogenase